VAAPLTHIQKTPKAYAQAAYYSPTLSSSTRTSSNLFVFFCAGQICASLQHFWTRTGARFSSAGDEPPDQCRSNATALQPQPEKDATKKRISRDRPIPTAGSADEGDSSSQHPSNGRLSGGSEHPPSAINWRWCWPGLTKNDSYRSRAQRHRFQPKVGNWGSGFAAVDRVPDLLLTFGAISAPPPLSQDTSGCQSGQPLLSSGPRTVIRSDSRPEFTGETPRFQADLRPALDVSCNEEAKGPCRRSRRSEAEVDATAAPALRIGRPPTAFGQGSSKAL